MNIMCPNCGQTCETEVELVIGQHVLCPFCNVKFTYGNSATSAESPSAGKLMDVKCPGCGTEYEVEASDVGQEVECEVCGRKTVRTDVFILTNMGGERRVCDVANPEEAGAVVKAFRTLLKQKKL